MTVAMAASPSQKRWMRADDVARVDRDAHAPWTVPPEATGTAT